jgi:hypothetical protein
MDAPNIWPDNPAFFISGIRPDTGFDLKTAGYPPKFYRKPNQFEKILKYLLKPITGTGTVLVRKKSMFFKRKKQSIHLMPLFISDFN